MKKGRVSPTLSEHFCLCEPLFFYIALAPLKYTSVCCVCKLHTELHLFAYDKVRYSRQHKDKLFLDAYCILVTKQLG